MPGREKIDPELALRIYAEVGDWHLVAQVMTHASGQPFATNSICAKVRAYRKEQAAAAVKAFDSYMEFINAAG